MRSQARHEHFMRLALGEAYRGIHKGEGGPFGACVIMDGRVVAVAHNRVLRSRNPTLHAEVVAIGRAARRLGTHLLDGCTIYSTTGPCPIAHPVSSTAHVTASVNWRPIFPMVCPFPTWTPRFA